LYSTNGDSFGETDIYDYTSYQNKPISIKYKLRTKTENKNHPEILLYAI
jgi:hypothetical protein